MEVSGGKKAKDGLWLQHTAEISKQLGVGNILTL